MRINIDNCIKYLLIWAGIFLPIQAMFVFVFHLPNSVQMIYPFIIIGIILCLFIPQKEVFNSLDKKFVLFYILLLIALLLSSIINYDSIIDRGLAFSYYTRTFPGFWDMPKMRLINWGVLRPFLFFLYICILFVLLQRQNNVKILLKSLSVLAVISCIYSVYQLIASQFGLPFNSIFSGQSGHVIRIWGNLIRTEGIFYEAGPHATFLSPIFCIFFAQLFEKNKNLLLFKKENTIKFFILISFIMFFTFSPIAFLTPIIALPLLKVLNYKTIKYKISKKYLTILTFIILLITPILCWIHSYVVEQSNGEFQLSNYMQQKILISTATMDSPLIYTNPDARSVRNYAGIQMFKKNKLFGVGPSAAIVYYFKYVPFATQKQKLWLEGVINTHIKMLCENGIIGFIPYLLIILYPIFLYIKKYKSLKYKNKLLIDALLVGYILYILLSYQATLEFFKAYFWMIYVSLVVLLNGKENESENKEFVKL